VFVSAPTTTAIYSLSLHDALPISGQTGVVAEDGGTNGGVILKAADGRNITIELSGGTTDANLANLGLAESGTNYAGFTLTAANANTPIKIEGGNGTGNGDIANAGLKVGNYTAQTAATSSTKATVGSDVVSIVNAISTDGGPVTADPGSNIDLTDFSAAATVADLATELADVHADLNAWTAGTATGTPPADTDDADDWAAYLTQLQADLGFTPSTGHGITTTGLGNALTAGEIAGVQAFVAD